MVWFMSADLEYGLVYFFFEGSTVWFMVFDILLHFGL